MTLPALRFPIIDPTPIFELFRGAYATELLTAAVAHFGVFALLEKQPLPMASLRQALQLEERPAHVLITALRAMQLVEEQAGLLQLTPLAKEHLIAGTPFDVGDYLSLAAQSPGVLAMVECLRTNRPLNSDNTAGAAFIYRDGIASAMEQSETARHFTLALAGRAKNVAPHVAANFDFSRTERLLDLGGGTGIYALEIIKHYAQIEAIVFDRPEVLRVAEEFLPAASRSRITLQSGDMFTDPLPSNCDTILLSNILHDWDVPACQELIQRCVAALPSGGKLLIHDVFLNDDLSGPLPIALYSAALFTFTEGRAYSQQEYAAWMSQYKLAVQPMIPTYIHCGILCGIK
jgi:ubiquinone/menaquinone biosynthesis C-methylase UbiE